MLISVVGFGSIWTRRIATAGIAYYNTTGVLVGGALRHRSCVYGVARFNGSSGFRPDCMHQMLYQVFECEPPGVWRGHNKLLLKSLVRKPARPDAYLVTIMSEQSGGINRCDARGWLHKDVQLHSFSECRERQEAMIVMPAYTWLRGQLGAFFLEPLPHKPWEARLVLSSAI